jgi:hypothetical protein
MLLIAVVVPVVLICLLVGMCIIWKLYWKGKKTHFKFLSIKARVIEIIQQFHT